MGALLSISAITMFNGGFVTATEPGINEIIANPTAYDNQPVIIKGVVTEWEINDFTITVTGEDDFTETFVVERYYLKNFERYCPVNDSVIVEICCGVPVAMTSPPPSPPSYPKSII